MSLGHQDPFNVAGRRCPIFGADQRTETVRILPVEWSGHAVPLEAACGMRYLTQISDVLRTN
jgi:hypothetical protein